MVIGSNIAPNPPEMGGCDEAQINSDPNQNPNLFVFPYDFRKDNAAVSAVKLRNYVNCVRLFHPNKDITIISHSQGGLVGSRYIFENPSNHHIKKMISIATPYLGAPKAIQMIETGGEWNIKDAGFLLSVIRPGDMKYIAESLPSGHQLLPSRRYFDLVGNNVFTEIGDYNRNGISNEVYDYNLMKQLLDDRYPRFTPGETGRLFHDPQSGQKL